MINAPFQALQNMYLFDPITGKPKSDANPIMLKIAIDRKNNDAMLQRLKSMRVQAINKLPEWENCIDCCLPDGEELSSVDKNVIFNTLSGALVHKNKIPLEIAKFKNSYFVRTENA